MSTRMTSKRVATHVSQYNQSVTLFEMQGLETTAEDTPRRSKRVKTEVKSELATLESMDILMDLEDLKSSPLNSSDNNAIASTTRTTKLESETSSTSTPKKSKSDVKSSPKKIKAIPQTLATPHPAPSNWRETYDAIKAMRSQFVAPVDTMGCDQAQWKESDPKNRRYATLVSLMLSSQTKDEVTDAAVSKLREALGGSLTVQGMIEAEDAVISEAIAKVGFWRRKTGYLKQAAVKLRDDFASDVPKTVDELCSLPGVGPKMAFLALQIAWNLNHGIGVDVHVHRITNLLGWHKPPTKTPEQTRLNLQSWLPKELHGDINHMLVGFGQVVCLPVGPRCDVCDLSKKGLCPSARTVVKATKKRKAIVFCSDKVMPSTSTSHVEDLDSPAKVEIKLEDDMEEAKVHVGPEVVHP